MLRTRPHALLRYGALAGAAALAAVLAGCGAPAGAALTPEEAAACTAAAQQAYESTATVDPTQPFAIPTTPVDAASAAGKRVAILSGSQAIPPLKEKVEAVQAALERAGIEVTIFDTEARISLQSQFMQQALNQGFDAIYTDGVEATTVASLAVQAEQQGTPVVLAGGYPYDPQNYPPLDGFYAMSLTNNLDIGKLKADYALWQSGCAGEYALMTVDYSLFKVTHDASVAEIARICPGCTARTYQVDFVTDLVGSARTNALAALTAQPDLAGVITADAWALFQIEPIRQAVNGADVQIFTEGAATEMLPLVADGTVTADVQPYSTSPEAALTSADLVLRGLTGLPADTGITLLPVSVITSENRGEVLTYEADFDRLLAEYSTLWGLT